MIKAKAPGRGTEPVPASKSRGAGQNPTRAAAMGAVDSSTAAEGKESGKEAAGLFSIKAAAATVGGGLLTLGITMAQITYSEHLEVLRRQDDQGVQFQTRLFDTTGRIHNEIVDTINLVKRHAFDEAHARVDTNLEEMVREWALIRLTLRIRGAQIYGYAVGNLIYDPREDIVEVDHCNVEVLALSPNADGDCTVRRRAEAGRLRGLQARLVANRVASEELDWRPASFETHFRLTYSILRKYTSCLTDPNNETGAIDPQCESLEDTAQIVASRLDLLALARENISSAIMRSSALRN